MKMVTWPNGLMFNLIPNKTSMTSRQNKNTVLKLTRKLQGLQWSSTVITSIKSRGEGTDVKLHYEDLLMKTAVCWHKNRHTNPRNRINGLEINPHSYSHHRHWSKDSLFNKCCLENWLFACRGMKTRSLPPCTKIH